MKFFLTSTASLSLCKSKLRLASITRSHASKTRASSCTQGWIFCSIAPSGHHLGDRHAKLGSVVRVSLAAGVAAGLAGSGGVCVAASTKMESELDVERLVLSNGIQQQQQQAESAVLLVAPAAETTTTVKLSTATKKHLTKKSVVPLVALTVVQFLYAGQQILVKVALVSGMDPLFFSVYRNVVAFLFLAPAAFFLERDARPKMTLSTFGGLNLLAFFGILGNQQLFLLGLKLTSPLFTAVSQNMVPVITFLLAVLFGMERISLRKKGDHARMVGTGICIAGAVTMSLYKGSAISAHPWPHWPGHATLHAGSIVQAGLVVPAALDLEVPLTMNHWSLGVICLLLNCTSWGMYLVSQGSVLQKYPALLTMVAIMELLGSIQVAIVAVAYEGFRCLDLRPITTNQIIIILYGGIVTSGINLALQAWCVEQVGPFIVSLFNPVQTLIVAVLAILLLDDTLYTGLLIGGILIIGGFYTIIYGQRIERRRQNALTLAGLSDTKVNIKQSDLKEPLLA